MIMLSSWQVGREKSSRLQLSIVVFVLYITAASQFEHRLALIPSHHLKTTNSALSQIKLDHDPRISNHYRRQEHNHQSSTRRLCDIADDPHCHNHRPRTHDLDVLDSSRDSPHTQPPTTPRGQSSSTIGSQNPLRRAHLHDATGD
jgi:hypothetical protein